MRPRTSPGGGDSPRGRLPDRSPRSTRLIALLAAGGLAGMLLAACSHLARFDANSVSRRPALMSDAAGRRLLTIRFYSRALGRVADYLVYLPVAYSPTRRLPAFYMLHGMPGRPLAFTVNGHVEIRLENLISRRRLPPMILVFPDGRIAGRTSTDSEWANTAAGRFDSYVVDVVHDVDSRFATVPQRRDRVIAGLSAGAYGAINVGLHHLALFGSIQVWSGYFTQTRAGVFARATRAELAYNSPIEFVRTLSRQLSEFPLRAFLFVGQNDSDRPQLAPMAAALRARGANVRDAVFSGGHSWRLWDAHLDQMLMLAAHDVRQPFARARP